MAGCIRTGLLAVTLPDHMKIVFLGTGEIGLPSLKYLLGNTDHQVVAVVTQPDKPVGRKMVLTPPAVKVLALEAGVPVFQPEKIRDFVPPLRALEADLFVVVAYGQLLTQAVLDIPKIACINLHASLLPKHRGASPIQAAILAGDAETAMTVMFISLGLDSGDILLTERIPLTPQETGGSLHDRLAEIGPSALAQALPLLASGQAPRTPQDPALVTHCRKLLREHGVIDWTLPATELERRIRAFDPWPGTSSQLPMPDGSRKLLKLFPPVDVADEQSSAAPGTVISADANGLVVACGQGTLTFHHLQLEGKRRMTVGEFLTGTPLAPCSLLG
jgi:methionyl-tRNA formyltransferase